MKGPLSDDTLHHAPPGSSARAKKHLIEKLTSAAAAMIHDNGDINSSEGGSHRNHIRNGCRSTWLRPFAFKSEDAARLENVARGIGLVSSLRVAR